MEAIEERGEVDNSDIEDSSEVESSDIEEEDTEDETHGVPRKYARMTENSPPPLHRPSDYLRSRCPLCFGGRSTLADGLV